MPSSNDPFDELVGLEEDFYNEGLKNGQEDGEQAGLIEGRFFGLEKGFEKYLAMGEMHGRATVWAGRLADAKDKKASAQASTADELSNSSTAGVQSDQKVHNNLASQNSRLTGHLRTLYALTEPESLSTANDEDSVADFDDRLKRAEGKVKIIEKITGEQERDISDEASARNPQREAGGNIEDTSILNVRH